MHELALGQQRERHDELARREPHVLAVLRRHREVDRDRAPHLLVREHRDRLHAPVPPGRLARQQRREADRDLTRPLLEDLTRPGLHAAPLRLPAALPALALDEDRRRRLRARVDRAAHVVEHALGVAALQHVLHQRRHLQPDLPRIVQEVGDGERILTREQDVVVGPERVLRRGALGGQRGAVGVRVQLADRQVPPDVDEAVQRRAVRDRPVRGGASRGPRSRRTGRARGPTPRPRGRGRGRTEGSDCRP